MQIGILGQTSLIHDHCLLVVFRKGYASSTFFELVRARHLLHVGQEIKADLPWWYHLISEWSGIRINQPFRTLRFWTRASWG